MLSRPLTSLSSYLCIFVFVSLGTCWSPLMENYQSIEVDNLRIATLLASQKALLRSTVRNNVLGLRNSGFLIKSLGSKLCSILTDGAHVERLTTSLRIRSKQEIHVVVRLLRERGGGFAPGATASVAAGNSEIKSVQFPELGSTVINVQDMKKILEQFPAKEIDTKHRRSLFITSSMRTLYSDLAQTERGWTRVLTGASGVGKSTTLLFIGHMALSSGCIVFSLQGHELLRGDVQGSAQIILCRWMKAMSRDLLSEIECPLTDDRSLFDLVSIGAKDRSRSISIVMELIENLCLVDYLPVVILIDQCNAFHGCTESKDSSEVAKLCHFFSTIGQLSLARGCLIRAYSAAFSVMPIAKDGDSLFNFRIEPMDSATFAQFVQTLIESFQPKTTDLSADSLFSLCAGLPREAVAIFFLVAQYPNYSLDQIRAEYFNVRTKFYEHRIKKMMDKRQMADALRQESVVFAARLFIGERMESAPTIWEEAGLVLQNGTHMCVPCEAAERGLIKSFDEDTAKAAILIYRSDPSTKWRALELAFIYVIHQCMNAGYSVVLECTDLLGDSPSTVLCSVDKIVHHSTFTQPSSIEKGTLIVCSKGAAAVDFVLYGKDGKKYYIQVSESAFADHSSKIIDVSRIDATYQDARVQTLEERQIKMQYIYITTSAKRMRSTNKSFNSDVLLVSNAGSKNANQFFRKLI